MPFTLSHPAFATPLRRLFPKLCMGGLVLGSMAPDLEYFVRMEAFGTIGHTLTGFVLIDLPLCAALFCAYIFVVQHVLYLWLPPIFGLRDYAYAKTRKLHGRKVSDWLWFLLSAFAGYGTHLFMDAWTHSSGLFVRHFVFLRQDALGLPLYHQLQLGFSMFGAVLIAAWIVNDWLSWARTNKGANSGNASANSNGAMLLAWTATAVLSLGTLITKLRYSQYPGRLEIWVVLPFSSIAAGIFLTALLLAAYQARRTAKGIGIAVSFAAIVFALLEGFVPFVTRLLGFEWTATAIWVGEIWFFSAAMVIVSLVIQQIVNNFVRNGLKTFNKRTVLF